MYYTFMQENIVIAGNLISYLHFKGPTPNLTVLFLHGWRSQKEIWTPVIQKLVGENSRVSAVALDLPGFGSSPAPKRPWEVGDYAECVKQFIEKLELQNIYLVGHSFGGRIGIKLAAQHGEIIKKLVLVDSAGLVVNSWKKTLMALAAKMLRPFFKPPFMQSFRQKIYKKIGGEDYITTPELQATLAKVVSEDLSADMKNIRIPALIMWGDKDTDTPVEFGQRMNLLIPNSKFIILSNAGHYSFLDKPKEFMQEFLPFISA
jgi:pimeloyl-ACP methyl ester carboxylesterase